MHLFALFRGERYSVERAINDLNAKCLKYDYHNADGTITPGFLSVMCNPIVPVEIIFPKEHLSCIVNTLGGEKALQGQESVGHLKKYVKWFRKFMKLKPIENIDPDVLKLPIHAQDIEIIGLGIKEDRTLCDGNEGI